MKMKDNKHTQGQMTDYKERLRKISDPVKKAEESCRIADEMYDANYEKIKAAEDERLRLKIVSMTTFSLDEANLVYEFIKGNNNALSELREFREWKKEKAEKNIEDVWEGSVFPKDGEEAWENSSEAGELDDIQIRNYCKIDEIYVDHAQGTCDESQTCIFKLSPNGLDKDARSVFLDMLGLITSGGDKETVKRISDKYQPKKDAENENN